MPGQAACFRCGSLLEAKAGAVEVHPPRAPGWKKPFRWAARRMRHLSAARAAERLAQRAADRTAAVTFGRAHLPGLPRAAGVPYWGELWRALRDAAVALALSIVPGLAHAVRHQFGAIYLYVISWFVSLALGILFFGRSLGSASMASAFVLHAWIAMDAVVLTKQFKEKMTALARMGWRLFGIAFGVFLLYEATAYIQGAIGLTVGDAGIAVPALRVELGDTLLCRFVPEDAETPQLKRGDLVLIHAHALLSGDGRTQFRGGYVGETVGQLVALPGDQLALTKDGFAVNGRALDSRRFPVPASLRGQTAYLRLGNGEYFVTMEWAGHYEGAAAAAQVTVRGCVYERQDVLARGWMRWYPLRRRGLLEELE